MKRASKYVIPWYRVYTDLIHLPKYQNLSLTDKGALHTFWGIAYRNHSEVGMLKDDLRILGSYLGPGFARHPKRVKDILERFADMGWLDRIVSGIDVRYKIHHWEEWQADRFDEFEPRNLRQNVADTTPVCDRVATELRHFGASVVDSKHTCSPSESKSKRGTYYMSTYNKSRDCVTGPLFELDDFETGINQAVIPDIELQNKAPRKPKRIIPEAESTLYDELLAYMEDSFMVERKISLPSISNQSDYVALRALVRRLLPVGYGLNSLQAAWARFLHSEDRWVRRQGHPIRYWSSNLGSFLSDSNQGQVMSRADRVEREVGELMAEMDREKLPDYSTK